MTKLVPVYALDNLSACIEITECLYNSCVTVSSKIHLKDVAEIIRWEICFGSSLYCGCFTCFKTSFKIVRGFHFYKHFRGVG